MSGKGRQNRYPVKLIVLAQRMHEQGKGPTDIRREIASHYKGPTPSLHTVRTWVCPSTAEAHRRYNRESARRRRLRGGQPIWASGQLDDESLDRRLLELRELKMSYPAITAIVARYHGATLTEHQIRGRLHRLGAPRMPTKARCPTAVSLAERAAA